MLRQSDTARGRGARPLLSLSPGSSAPREAADRGVAARKKDNTVLFLGPLAVHQITPTSQPCSPQLGRGRNLLETPTHSPPKVTVGLPSFLLEVHPQSHGPPVVTRIRSPGCHLLAGCSPPATTVCECGVPRRWRSAACPWSSPSGWAPGTRSRLAGTAPCTPPATSCGSACPRSRTPMG